MNFKGMGIMFDEMDVLSNKNKYGNLWQSQRNSYSQSLITKSEF